MKNSAISYKRHRFPQQIIAHAVWLYLRFPLSLRLVEEMLLERSIVVSYETIRRWGRKFGPAYAKQTVGGGRRTGTSGIWTRWRSRSLAASTGFGVPLTRTVMFSTRSFRADAIPRLPSDC